MDCIFPRTVWTDSVDPVLPSSPCNYPDFPTDPFVFFRWSIRRRFIYVIDYDHVNRVLVVFQFQSQLFLQRGEKRRQESV
jgi:hypothetical protein